MAIDLRRNGSDGRIVKDGTERKVDVKGFLNLGEKVSAEKRVSAEKKEIVVWIDLADFQKRGDDGHQRCFGARSSGRRSSVLQGICGIGRRQSDAIHFAARSKGKRVQNDKRVGNHVIGQVRLQMFTQSAGVNLGALLQNHIGREKLAAGGLFDRNYDSGLNGFLFAKNRGNFVWLDTVATDLDLVVGAADEFETAARQRACEVACLVEARIRVFVERIGNEFFAGEFRVVQVT